MDIQQLLKQNKEWAKKSIQNNPQFFENFKVQSPHFLWIGCSDSRVPADQITGTTPGQIFVHRNIANVVVHTDMNLLSVVQFAVEVLKVEDVIVCGHYGCGGVACALEGRELGLIDNWLRHIQDVVHEHEDILAACPTQDEKNRKLVELNAWEQAKNLSRTTIIQNAWKKSKNMPRVHAWVYDLSDGIIRDLKFSESGT